VELWPSVFACRDDLEAMGATCVEKTRGTARPTNNQWGKSALQIRRIYFVTFVMYFLENTIEEFELHFTMFWDRLRLFVLELC
jgi:hypothetical protein